MQEKRFLARNNSLKHHKLLKFQQKYTFFKLTLEDIVPIYIVLFWVQRKESRPKWQHCILMKSQCVWDKHFQTILCQMNFGSNLYPSHILWYWKSCQNFFMTSIKNLYLILSNLCMWILTSRAPLKKKDK